MTPSRKATPVTVRSRATCSASAQPGTPALGPRVAIPCHLVMPAPAARCLAAATTRTGPRRGITRLAMDMGRTVSPPLTATCTRPAHQCERRAAGYAGFHVGACVLVCETDACGFVCLSPHATVRTRLVARRVLALRRLAAVLKETARPAVETATTSRRHRWKATRAHEWRACCRKAATRRTTCLGIGTDTTRRPHTTRLATAGGSSCQLWPRVRNSSSHASAVLSGVIAILCLFSGMPCAVVCGSSVISTYCTVLQECRT